jgi:hypothetical protein
MSKKGQKKGGKSTSSSSGATDEATILKVFGIYADEDDPESMSMDGIGTICENIGINAETDVRALMLVWRLGAFKKPGCISKEEFLEGMTK